MEEREQTVPAGRGAHKMSIHAGKREQTVPAGGGGHKVSIHAE